MQDVQDHFQLFLAGYAAAWASPRFAGVLELWDPCEPEPWHFPEELDQPLVGREAIATYLDAAADAIESFSVQVDNSAIKSLEGSFYTFRFMMRWCASMRGSALLPKPIGAQVRVSGVLRDTGDGLKLVHYMEAGPAALPYLVAQYEQFAQGE
ncbi:MAG: nuclear transport factor 2 family protein [Congregibacter sp.]